MSTAQRVIKNTGFLYAKMGITVFVSLYTTRIVLTALGAFDFGIFNVVGGAIAMLGFLHAAMSSSTQRFMSFYGGRGEIEKQKFIFNVSSVLHFGIAIVLIVVLLIAGFFFFNGVLNIPPDRIFAAKVIYGSLILSTAFTVISVPYEAVLNAHENMLYYSIVGVIESLLKLSVALVILYYLGDKLVLYGILMAVIPFISRTIMQIYCHRKYSECVIAPRRYFDKDLAKEMTSFAGWSFLGTASGIITQYGLGLVLNNFFGTLLNAAQGIANQISGQLMVFSNTMMQALNPVIAKSEGSGNRKMMLEASIVGCKFSFFLLAVFAIPFMIEAPYLLGLWLNDVPPWAILFTRLQLLRSLIEQLTILIGRTIEVEGNIRNYTIVKSILNFLPIILSIILFKNGYPPYVLYIVWILCWGVIKGLISLLFSHRQCDLSYTDYFKNVAKPTLTVSTVMMVFGLILYFYMNEGFLRLLSVTTATTIAFILVYRLFFMPKQELTMFHSIYGTVKKKVFKK